MGGSLRSGMDHVPGTGPHRVGMVTPSVESLHNPTQFGFDSSCAVRFSHVLMPSNISLFLFVTSLKKPALANIGFVSAIAISSFDIFPLACAMLYLARRRMFSFFL